MKKPQAVPASDFKHLYGDDFSTNRQTPNGCSCGQAPVGEPQLADSLMGERLHNVYRVLQEDIKTNADSVECSISLTVTETGTNRVNEHVPQHFNLGDCSELLKDDLRRIGTGAFGIVYQGFMRIGGQAVVIKVPQVWVREKTTSLAREVLLCGHIKHEHILPFWGVCTYKGIYPCILSPFMKEGNLSQRAESTPLRIKYVLLSQIASALVYLHNCSPPIVHGDVRAVNILISDDGRALLADFGIARIDSQMFACMSSREQHGNVRWMAPELLFGFMGKLPKPRSGQQGPRTSQATEVPFLKASPQTDIWSFGMTFYESIACRIPYAEGYNDAYAIVRIHEHTLPERPEVEGENGETVLSDELWATILSCWNKDPKYRPKASILREKLEKAAREGPVQNL